MPSLVDHPRLRPLDIRLIEHEGRPSLLVQDQLALSGQYMILPYALGPVLFLCDGQHSVQEIARLVPEHFHVKLPDGMLMRAVERCMLKHGSGPRPWLRPPIW